MNAAGGKNLQKGEAIVYTPETHWIVTLRPVLTLCVALAVYIIKWVLESGGSVTPLLSLYIDRAAWIILIININFSAVIFLWQLVEYYGIEYHITNRRIILKRGLLKTTLTDLPASQIESVCCVKGLPGKIFGFGSVGVRGTGGRNFWFHHVTKPYSLRRVINSLVEYNRKITIIREEKPRQAGTTDYGVFVTSYPA